MLISGSDSRLKARSWVFEEASPSPVILPPPPYSSRNTQTMENDSAGALHGCGALCICFPQVCIAEISLQRNFKRKAEVRL